MAFINPRLISVRIVALATMLSLLLSAFPASFFVAFAASTGVTTNESTLTALVDEQVNFVATVTTDDTTRTAGTVVAVSDDGGGSFFSGTIGGECNSLTVDSEFAIDENKGICYSNPTAGDYTITVQLLDGPGGTQIGADATVTVEVQENTTSSVFPSTNAINTTAGFAYVEETASAPGEITLDFVSTRNFASCFEYRTDGDTSQIIATNGGVNFNPEITDGLYPFVCVTNETKQVTLSANAFVEVRLSFGAETDERFNWTRFDVQAPIPKDENTIVVTGDDFTLENGGWLFNRDSTTIFEFNDDDASIGNGSLFVGPVSDVPADKFIGENFIQVPVEDIDSFTYDFKIAGNGNSGDANEFYLNVYTNIDESQNFFDCRFDYVPSTGSTADFTTVTFDATDTPVNVSKRGVRIANCPATLAEMPAGSFVYFFSLSVGDTTDSDEGLAGYYDNVVLETASAITTWDFEPEPDTGKPTMTVIEPENGFVTNADFDIVIQATDNEELASVVVNLKDENGANLASCLNEPTGAVTTYDASCTVSVAALGEGEFGYKANARDAAGNISNTVSRLFTIDTTGPAITINTPVVDEVISQEVTVTGSATDPAGIEGDQVAVHLRPLKENGKCGAFVSSADATVGETGAFSTTFDVSAFLPGRYCVTVLSSDTVGNNNGGGNHVKSFVIVEPDITKPDVVITSPANGAVVADDPFTVTGTASDAQSEIEDVLYTVTQIDTLGGDYVASVDSGTAIGTNLWSFAVDALTAGFYRLKAQAFDTEGNFRYKFHDIEVVERPDASLVITNPETADQTLSGIVSFAAEYVDGDDTPDTMQWAVRTGDCGIGGTTVAGNVDGFTDVSSFDGASFGATVDMSALADGQYCFIANPNESSGPNLRETQPFFLENIVEVVYGAYCGDGIVQTEGANSWEQCEIGDEGCTEYCLFENQCSAEKLVKITLNETESVSFDGQIYLGAEDNIIPSGTWFNFNEVGDLAFNTLANGVQGLAVERNQENSELKLAFTGDNQSRQIDIVAGSIETIGIDLGKIDRSPNPSFKLEDKSPAFIDIFDKTDESIEFDMRVDTGNDGVSVEVGLGDEYNCPLTYTIQGAKWNDLDEDGIWDEEEPTLNGWTIQASDGETLLETTTDGEGNYEFQVEAGDWTVSEVQQIGWTQSAPDSELGVCEFNIPQNEVSFYECNFGNYEESQPEVSESTLACDSFTTNRSLVDVGNPIILSWNTTDADSVVIDTNIGAVASDGSIQVNVPVNEGTVTYTLTAINGEETVTCSTAVEVREMSGGGGGSAQAGIVAGASISTESESQVLGVTTSNQCDLYLTEYMKSGQVNDVLQVTKLQTFLNEQGFITPYTGVFDITTENNVKAFQQVYSSEILLPWVAVDPSYDLTPSGYVFKTTRWKINDMKCPGIQAFPELP